MPATSTKVSPGGVKLPAAELASIINGCFQCGKCSAGCPVAEEMDLLPHQLVRLAVMGGMDRIVNSKSIWLCLTCHTCGARCPNGIDVPTLLDPIRHQMLQRGFGDRTSPVPTFHTSFMQNVKIFGRVHELSLIGLYKLKTKTFFNDMELGISMFQKGKIHLIPKFAAKLEQVKEIFRQSGMK